MKRERVKYARNRQVLRRYELDTPRVPCPSLRAGAGALPVRKRRFSKLVFLTRPRPGSRSWQTVGATVRRTVAWDLQV